MLTRLVKSPINKRLHRELTKLKTSTPVIILQIRAIPVILDMNFAFKQKIKYALKRCTKLNLYLHYDVLEFY